MPALRAALAALLCCPVIASCSVETTDQKVSACWQRGMEIFRQGPDESVRSYVRVCMAAKGYDWRTSRKGCPEDLVMMYYDQACYVQPQLGWLGF